MVIINSKLLLIAFSSFVFGYVTSSWIDRRIKNE